tara:strand:- start:182 stop:412 length:231 start_codon:yes stop_codon:yes gene_type:complete
VFPNPSTTTIYFKYLLENSDYQLKKFRGKGELVFDKVVSNENNYINISNLLIGVCTIQLVDAKYSSTFFRFVKNQE